MKSMFAAAAVLAIAASANADIVNVKYTGKASGSNVRISLNGSQQDVFAGQLKHMFSGATGASSYINGTWITYCSDLTEHVTSTSKVYTIVDIAQIPAMGANATPKSQALSRLYSYAGNTAVASTASNDWATAFQLTVWEIVSDYSPGSSQEGLALTSGSFTAKRTNNAALPMGISSLVNEFFSVATGNGPSVPLVGVTNAGAQDQIVMVPAPGALTLAGFGGLLAATRGNRSRNAK